MDLFRSICHFCGVVKVRSAKLVEFVIKNFFAGSFIANEFAIILIVVFQLEMRGRKGISQVLPVAHTKNSCHVTDALISGFCGTLSTINT